MKRYSFVSVFILSLITCGLYFLHVISVISINNNAIAQRAQKKSIMHVVPMVLAAAGSAIVLGAIGIVGDVGICLVLAFLVPIVIAFIWYYQFCRQQCEILEVYGRKATPAHSPIVLVLMGFIPIYSYYVLCENYNMGVNASEGIV